MNLLEKMKQRGISTLEVHRVLEENGIHVSKRTLHDHLERDVLSVTNETAASVIDYLIKRYDETRKGVKMILKGMAKQSV